MDTMQIMQDTIKAVKEERMNENEVKRPLTVRLPEQKARLFSALAKLEGLSISTLLENLIDQYIDQKKHLLSEAQENLSTTGKGGE